MTSVCSTGQTIRLIFRWREWKLLVLMARACMACDLCTGALAPDPGRFARDACALDQATNCAKPLFSYQLSRSRSALIRAAVWERGVKTRHGMWQMLHIPVHAATSNRQNMIERTACLAYSVHLIPQSTQRSRVDPLPGLVICACSQVFRPWFTILTSWLTCRPHEIKRSAAAGAWGRSLRT